MIKTLTNTKYQIKGTTGFKKGLKKVSKQGKDINKLNTILYYLANDMPLDSKYKDHALEDNDYLKNCRECHIEPDWLLVYKKDKKNLVLVLLDTGSHSNLFAF